MSARVDASKLDFANILTQRKFGMSFAQYCGQVVLDDVCQNNNLPLERNEGAEAREKGLLAVQKLREVSKLTRDSKLANMPDAEIKRAIRNREL